DGVTVSSVLNEQKLTLLFNAVLAFDLADAKVAAPPNVASITQRADADTSTIDITLIGEVDVHSFREEKNYIIAVAFPQPETPAAEALAQADPHAHASATAKPLVAAAAGHGKSVKEQVPLQQPAPVTSETFAEQARIETKPGQSARPPAME